MCAGPTEPTTQLDPMAGAQLQLLLKRLMARDMDDMHDGQPRESLIPQIESAPAQE
jgi:hypothetical protein